jgi:23S rRNA (guanine745-N1)-methyltransferase
VCARPLSGATDGTLRGGLDCPVGHHFDTAKQGYVDLVAGALRHEGDSAAMVAARADFLAAGHFDFLSTALVEAARPTLASGSRGDGGLVVDVGAGPGSYLAALLRAYPRVSGLALDVSKAALRRAARAHPRALAARVDAWRGLQVADDAVDLLVNVFAPRNGAEFARVLRGDGELLVVTPAAGHLGELVRALDLLRVDPAKSERLGQSLHGWFAPAGVDELTQPLRLGHAEVLTLIGMGPSAWHTDPRTLAAAVARLPEPTPATARVLLHHYRPR